jgi:S1-C subfamily serine protease
MWGMQDGALNPEQSRIWKGMEPAIVTIVDHGIKVGPAALIDGKGLFVAASSAVHSPKVLAVQGDGKTVTLTLLNREVWTGLALLKCEKWQNAGIRPFSAPLEDEAPGSRLIVVLADGPIPAEFVSGRRSGFIEASQRLLPLSEFEFENPAEHVGTALVFCENGDFLGSLNSTLKSLAPGEQEKTLTARSIGPNPKSVAYAAGVQIVRQVIEGFRSTGHQVSFGSLGIVCETNPAGGVNVVTVVPGSAAEKGTLLVGDIILEVAGTKIHDLVDFSRAMFSQRAGNVVLIRLSRKGGILTFDVKLDRYTPVPK